jgi:integrase
MATKRTSGIQERINRNGAVSYRAQVRMRGHPHLSKTFARITDAKIWLRDMGAAIRGGKVISTEADRTTLREALERYKREITPKKKGARREQQRIDAWLKHPLAYRFLSRLRGQDFAEYRDARRAQGKAENTIRIELALVGRLYQIAAKDWGMEGLRNPIRNITLPGGSRKRERRLAPAEEEAVLAQLEKLNPYMRPLAQLALETAMRRGELLALTWADVNLSTQVARLHDTKNSESRDVPLSSRAVEILKGLPRPLDSGSRIFPLSGDDVSHLFHQACMAAGIENLKFHDLRHEATSRICKLVPMHAAMRITGHKTPAMLMRYYHPKAEELARKLG